MTFQQLKYLQEVARTHSVAQAAKNLFVSPSSVSIAVGNLEKELGYELFFRSEHGLAPTQRGQKVLEHAERICRSCEQLYAVDQDPVRTIRINCSDHPIFARSVARLMAENRDRQDLRFEITAYRSMEFLRRLISNELDISLTRFYNFSIGYWEARLRKAELHRQILKNVPVCIQVGPGHRLYGESRVCPHDLDNEVLLDDPHKPLSRFSPFSGTFYTDPERTVFAAHRSVQDELLLQGMCYRLAMLPPVEEQENTLLRSIPLDGISFYISAITNPQTPDAPEILRLLQILKKGLDAAYPEENAIEE